MTLRISALVFADDVVLSGDDFQLVHGQFSAVCEAAGMKISSSKPEPVVISQKRVT